MVDIRLIMLLFFIFSTKVASGVTELKSGYVNIE
jgi:hypothetical protein